MSGFGVGRRWSHLLIVFPSDLWLGAALMWWTRSVGQRAARLATLRLIQQDTTSVMAVAARMTLVRCGIAVRSYLIGQPGGVHRLGHIKLTGSVNHLQAMVSESYAIVLREQILTTQRLIELDLPVKEVAPIGHQHLNDFIHSRRTVHLLHVVRFVRLLRPQQIRRHYDRNVLRGHLVQRTANGQFGQEFG